MEEAKSILERAVRDFDPFNLDNILNCNLRYDEGSPTCLFKTELTYEDEDELEEAGIILPSYDAMARLIDRYTVSNLIWSPASNVAVELLKEHLQEDFRIFVSRMSS